MPASKTTTRVGSAMKAALPGKGAAESDPVLFDRVAGILEQARAGVVRAVNSHMVMAYWLIGREIVQGMQGGKGRAEYGRQVLGDLSRKLTERYGVGFSVTNLQNFRLFYQAYADRVSQIQHPLGVKSALLKSSEEIQRPLGVELPLSEKGHPLGDEFTASLPSMVIPRPPGAKSLRRAAKQQSIRHPESAELTVPEKSYPAGSQSLSGFSPQLSWSHYRALMRVERAEARKFYEREAIAGAWDKRTLERQIHSFYYERLLKSQHPEKMLAEGRHSLASPDPAIATLKHPYVLEFLGLPEVAALQETDLEKAILSYLPTEEELRREIAREQRLIEAAMESPVPAMKRRMGD